MLSKIKETLFWHDQRKLTYEETVGRIKSLVSMDGIEEEVSQEEFVEKAIKEIPKKKQGRKSKFEDVRQLIKLETKKGLKRGDAKRLMPIIEEKTGKSLTKEEVQRLIYKMKARGEISPSSSHVPVIKKKKIVEDDIMAEVKKKKVSNKDLDKELERLHIGYVPEGKEHKEEDWTDDYKEFEEEEDD